MNGCEGLFLGMFWFILLISGFWTLVVGVLWETLIYDVGGVL